MRICVKCQAEFGGRGCSKCKSARAKVHRAENKEILANKGRVYCAANAERIKITKKAYNDANKGKIKTASALWLANNQERDKLTREAYRRNNVEKRRKAVNVWRAANEEKRRTRGVTYANTRRMKIKNVGGVLSDGLFDQLFLAQDGKCVYCKLPLSRTTPRSPMDHMVAVSAGGLNVDENIQLLCLQCNSRKGITSHTDYLKKLKESA